MSPSYLFKVVTVGSAAVGKTSMILRYVTGRFREYYAPTLGADFSVKHMEFDKDTVKLQIWDLGSQDFLGHVRAGFYPGSRGVVFLYDVTREDSFKELYAWKKEVDTHIKNYQSVIVANKTDLEEERTVTKKDGKKVAKEFGASYIETSVKLNENVDDAFKLVGEHILEEFR
ncbi:MAG: Rab family GTPase [Candidatus Thorarchaeota archaeon]